MRAAQRLVAVLAVVPVTAGVALLAQSRPPTAASTIIDGRVVTADTGVAIPYARIRVGGGSVVVRSDPNGAFTIAAPRTATLIVGKAGYVQVEQRLFAAAAVHDVRLTRAAAISGRVTNDLGEPVVAATVTATPDGSRSIARAVTDDHGVYRIGGLRPDSYRVSVQTSGAEVLPLAQPGGSAEPATGTAALRETTTVTFFPGTLEPSQAAQVRLSAGDDRHGIDVQVRLEHMMRQPLLTSLPLPFGADNRSADGDGATIHGLVADPQGRPLPFALVTLQGDVMTAPAAPASSRPASLVSVFRTTVADEQGAYAFDGLRGGFYSVRAAKAGYSPEPPDRARPTLFNRQGLRDGDVREDPITLMPWGAIAGRVSDEFGDPVHGATVQLLQFRYERGRQRLVEARVAPRQTDDLGHFRLFAVPPGDYVVTAAITGPETDLVGYAQTFYPGVLSDGDARPVSVALGADLSGIDVALVATPTAHVRGTMFDAAGRPATHLRPTLTPRSGFGTPLAGVVDADGNFDFANVPPGQYTVAADAGRMNTFTEGDFVAMPLVLGESDVLGLRLQVAPASTITGRFVFDRTTRDADPPPTSVAIAAVPADFDAAPVAFASAQAKDKKIFQLRGVTGARRLQITRMPTGYMLASVLVSGRDVTDQVIALNSGADALRDVQVVLTDRVTRLVATVAEDQQTAPAGTHVLVFSTDPAHWYPTSRYVVHGLTAADGRASFAGLPAGSYFAAAAPMIPPGDEAWQDPGFLDAVSQDSTTVVVRDAPVENSVSISRWSGPSTVR